MSVGLTLGLVSSLFYNISFLSSRWMLWHFSWRLEILRNLPQLPTLVQVVDVLDDPAMRSVYIAMELINGSSLSSILTEKKTVCPTFTLSCRHADVSLTSLAAPETFTLPEITVLLPSAHYRSIGST